MTTDQRCHWEWRRLGRAHHWHFNNGEHRPNPNCTEGGTLWVFERRCCKCGEMRGYDPYS